MKEIIVKSKKFGDKTILVDDSEYDRIASIRWNIRKTGNNFYANHSCYIGKDENGKFKYACILMHRLVLNIKKGIVDHIDRNTLNNQKSNLRMVTYSQNSQNKNPQVTNKFGYKGVSFNISTGKYMVRLTINKKVLYGGLFRTPKEAALRYNELAIEYHKEFAVLNKINHE